MGEYIQCSINFGIEITPLNRSIDFRIVSMGVEKQATLQVGLYNLTTLKTEIQRAMTAADPTNTYTVTIDRSVSGGTQNRLTIATSGAYLDLLFATGTRAASSSASLLGYTATDKTGATSYVGASTVGTLLVPTYPPQEIQPLGTIHDALRVENESTSGVIETVSFTTFRNFEFRLRWIEEGSSEFTTLQAYHIWLLRGGPIEFIEKITNTSNVSSGIPINLRTPLELSRMMPSMFDYFETPTYTFREVT